MIGIPQLTQKIPTWLKNNKISILIRNDFLDAEAPSFVFPSWERFCVQIGLMM